MTRVLRPLAALALLAAAGSAHAFVRETTAVGDPAAGTWLWWGKRQVTFQVNATSAVTAPGATAPCGNAASAAQLAAQSVEAWSSATRTGDTQACTDFTFGSGTATTNTTVANDGMNLVVFRTGDCSDTALVPAGDACHGSPGACAAKYDCWEHGTGTIGLTTTHFNTSTGEIYDADIEINGWSSKASTPRQGAFLTCAGPTASQCASVAEYQTATDATACNGTDIGAVVTHEAGHVLGLDHVCQYAAPYDGCPTPRPVMAPSVGLVSMRQLAPDDVDGICTIYPAGKPTVVGEKLSTGSGGGGGCASGGGAGGALALAGVVLALWSALRARRARALAPAPAHTPPSRDRRG